MREDKYRVQKHVPASSLCEFVYFTGHLQRPPFVRRHYGIFRIVDDTCHQKGNMVPQTRNSQKDMGGNLDFLESWSPYPIRILYIYIYIYILILIFIYLVREKERERERERLVNSPFEPFLFFSLSLSLTL